jgi:CRISPR-associated exonuclease Cas4
MSDIFLMLLFVVVILGSGLLLLSATLRRQTGLPGGRVGYSDTVAAGESLLAPRYGLVGKPDYIVWEKGRPIPVEVKPKRMAPEPYLSDVLQLAAYGLLVEETYGQTSPYGILRYAKESYRIDFTPQLRGYLLYTMAQMRANLRASDVPRNHNIPARCTACGFRDVCGQSLAE